MQHSDARSSKNVSYYSNINLKISKWMLTLIAYNETCPIKKKNHK